MDAIQVASLYATLDLRNNLTDALGNAKSTLKDFGGDLKDIGGTLTALGAPFLAFATGAVKAAADSEDSLAQLDAVLKSTGGAAGLTRDELIDMASAMQKTTRYSDDATISAESMLLTFTNIGAKAFPGALKAAANLSTAMKQDLKSSVIQIGKALNDPVNMLSSLTRVGVTFTEQTKEQIKVLQESGDLYGAQSIVLNELSREFGGSAEAAGKTLTGSLVILKNQFDDVMETIGGQLIPIVQQFTGWLGQLVTWFQNLDPNVQHTIVLAIALAAGLAIIGPILIGIGAGLSAITTLLSGPLIPIALIVGGLLLLAHHFGITLDQVKLYLSLIQLYAEYYFNQVVQAVQKVIDKVTEWIGQNPELMTMLTVIGIAVAVVIGIMAGVPIVLGLITTAAGLLTGALGLLFSPVTLLAIGIAGIIYAADKLYPGGIKKLFNDAQVAASQLAFLGMYVLATAAEYVRQKLAALEEIVNRIKTGIEGLGGIMGLLSSGQVSLGDVAKAAAAEFSQNGISPVTSGSWSGSNAVDAAKQYWATHPPSGYASGGYTGNAPSSQPVGVVHGREWVVPENGALVLRGGDTASGITISNLTINASTSEGGRAAADAFTARLTELLRERG